MSLDELRWDVQHRQRTHGPAAGLYDRLYQARNYFVEHVFEAGMVGGISEAYVPLLNVTNDPMDWRGQYSNIGPFGFAHVISLNAAKFRRADEMLVTLAHEMCHWFAREWFNESGHGHHWRNAMRWCGLTMIEDHAHPGGPWFEHEANLAHLHLNTLVLQ